MKIFRGISFIVVAIMIAVMTIISAGAETIYQYYGFSYTLISNYTISLVGWDNRADSFTLPNEINERSFISIGNYALEGNTQIKSVDLTQAKKLNRIGTNAFYGCTGLDTELVIPESVTVINNCAFQGCTSLPKVLLNANITEIPNQCFYNCTSLSEVNIPDTVEIINPWAFANCTSLEYVEIPQNVNYIAVSAFSNDPNLTLGVWYESYAYNYAKDNSISYILLDGVKSGDTNSDEFVSISDVTAIQRHLADIEFLDGIYLYAADINQDGVVDIYDATELQRFIAEYEVDYPIGEVIKQ